MVLYARVCRSTAYSREHMCLWYWRAAWEWAVCHLAANAAALPGRPAKQMDRKSTNDNKECPWHLYTCFYKSSQSVPEVQPFKRWRSGTTMFPLKPHIWASQRVILFTFIQIEMFLVFFAWHGKNLYVAPNIWLHMFGWTIRSVALFQLPSPRRQVDVSPISYSVTWRRNQAAGVKLLLRVNIRAKHAGFHETAGDSMWLSRDACQDRRLTLRLASASPRVRLKTVGGPKSKRWSEFGIQHTVFTVHTKNLMCGTDRKKNNVF